MVKLKLQYFGHLMRRADLLENTLILGKIEGRRRGDNRGWDGWMASPTRCPWVWASSGNWWWPGKPGVQSIGHKELDTTEQLNWTELLSRVSGKESVLLLNWVVCSIQFLLAAGLRSPFPCCQLRGVSSLWGSPTCFHSWLPYSTFKTSNGRLSSSHDLTLSCFSFSYLLFCLPVSFLRAHIVSPSPLRWFGIISLD